MAEDNSVMRKHHDKKTLPAPGLITGRIDAWKILGVDRSPSHAELRKIVDELNHKRYLNSPADSARLAAAKSLLNYQY